MSSRPQIAIIGPGKVGTTLAILAARAGYRIAGLAGRDLAKAQAAAELLSLEGRGRGEGGPLSLEGRGQGEGGPLSLEGRGRGEGAIRVGTPVEIAPLGRLVFLTVPDDAIAAVCADLAAAKAFSPNSVVAHCSGAIASDVLAPARRCGCAVASMHPLQTFPSVEAGVAKFAGTYCFCEGDERALAALEALAAAIGGKGVRLSSAGKLLYHASAVLACNYFIGLLDAALATAGKAGIARADALAALAPLVRATVDNVLAVGPEKALTGPIARGDDQLVARQARDLAAADPALGEIYCVLGQWTIDVALRKGTIDPAKAAALRHALE